MGAIRFFVMVLLTGILCIPPSVAGHNETGATSARGEYTQASPTTVTLIGSGSSYTDSSFKFTLPSGSTIQAASVDLEGLPVTGPTESATCDFGQPDASNHFAYKGSSNQNNPGNSPPSTFSVTQVPAGDRTLISTSDDKYAVCSVFGYPSPYGYQLFKFKVPYNNLSKATVNWEGFVGESYSGVGTATVYVWNSTQSAWETAGTGSQSPDSTITKDFFGPGYIDTDGYLYLLAFCTVGVSFYGEFITSVCTDYVKADVQGNSDTYPKNPSMDVGANGQAEWSLAVDKFNTKVSIGGVTIKYEIQDIVNKFSTQFTEIRVKFSSETQGKIRISNFRVGYNAPPWCKGIPDIAFDEDAQSPPLIDLNTYITDPDDLGVPQLKYVITFEEDSEKLDAFIDTDGHHLGFQPAANWWGTLSFRVRASDNASHSRESNTFKVTVNSVNDPPVLDPIPDQTAVEDVPWTIQVRASDPDIALDPMEEIRFSDNTSLFEVDPFSGNATFTPVQNQVGIYQIQIAATDSHDAVSTQNFTLEIKNAEDPPKLDPIPDQNATVGMPFNYTVVATDPDLPYGDSLSFSDDSTLFQIDSKSGLIAFTPAMSDIGSYRVNITVNDSRGGSDKKQFTLRILNTIGTMDHPPAIEPIPNQTVNAGVPFEYIVKASDPDITSGDILSFSDDCALFVIDRTGKILFTPQNRDAGVYRVNITTTDREGLSATTSFTLTVVSVNRPPVIVSISPANGTRVKLNERVTFMVNASDPDGDIISVTWKYKDKVIGYSINFPMSFNTTGTQTMVIIVSDGQMQLYREITVEVEKPSQTTSPAGGSEIGTLAIIALFIVIVAIISTAMVVLWRKPGLYRK